MVLSNYFIKDFYKRKYIYSDYIDSLSHVLFKSKYSALQAFQYMNQPDNGELRELHTSSCRSVSAHVPKVNMLSYVINFF